MVDAFEMIGNDPRLNGSHLNGVTQVKKGGRKEDENNEKSYIGDLISIQEKLRLTSSGQIKWMPPILLYLGQAIIRKYTINTIQGKMGSHKSRFAELLCSLILNVGSKTNFLGFECNNDENCTVVYVDTERNQKDELPSAIQEMKMKAGYLASDHPKNFYYTSLRNVPRSDRLTAIKEFLKWSREQTEDHLFVCLDVVTDCVKSFNDDRESMELLDFLNNLCDHQNATFLLVIHENPGSEKGRGHLGTEAGNKASTMFQIGIEKVNEMETDVIRLKFTKTRRIKKPEPLYLTYCDQAKGLVSAGEDLIKSIEEDRRRKANYEDFVDALNDLLDTGERKPKEVIEHMVNEFKASKATIKKRLKALYEEIEFNQAAGIDNVFELDKKPHGNSFRVMAIKLKADDDQLSIFENDSGIEDKRSSMG